MSDESEKQTDESNQPLPPAQSPQQNPVDAPGQNQGSQTQQQQQQQFEQQQQQFFALPGLIKTPQTSTQFSLPGFDFFTNYQSPASVFDEVCDDSGELRWHWQLLADELAQLSGEGLKHRVKQVRRMIYQNGIAYSAYGDATARREHLQLDPIPQLYKTAEWCRIGAALAQRAELLNLLLADIYGPRTLLTSNVLPVDVLLNHPDYHLSHHGLPSPGGKHLHFYAAEIIRSPEGDWWVKADRTGSPGGIGFALENRIAISRAFPSIFRVCNVRRLAPYFIAMRDHLKSLAKTNVQKPRIAILSSGVSNSRYFEDSFLAKYLGFTLVETNDLVVRSGKVMLKTLEGLSQVDVIYQRHRSSSLDPLEIGGSSPGVPGLLQVIREGNVVVVNSPGAGLVESPIFMAFMPRICRALLGEDLEIPGVATWWGGEVDSLSLMLDRIDEIYLYPAYRRDKGIGKSSGGTSEDPETMTREERISLLQTNPTDWVGQEKVARSSSPVLNKGKLTTGFISIRSFLTLSGSKWQSLPGGLVRVATSPYQSTQTTLKEDGAKDAWVLADSPVEQTSLLKKPNEPLAIVRGMGFLPSRIGDNLCWLGRYLERADASARLLRTIANRLTGENDPREMVELPALVRAFSHSGDQKQPLSIDEFFSGNFSGPGSALAVSALNPSSMDSLRFQVEQIVMLSGTVRDRLSSDAWRIVQEMGNSVTNSSSENCDLVDLLHIVDDLVVGLAAFGGFVGERMTRTHAYNFLNIGRRLEHSLQIAALIKNCFARQKEVPSELLEAVLETSESALTYRSRYYANFQLPAVFDLVIADEMNPRSLAYQLKELVANLALLPENSSEPGLLDGGIAKDLAETARTVNALEICEIDSDGKRSKMRDLLETVEKRLPEISTLVSNRFFVHSGPVQQLIVEPEDRKE